MQIHTYTHVHRGREGRERERKEEQEVCIRMCSNIEKPMFKMPLNS